MIGNGGYAYILIADNLNYGKRVGQSPILKVAGTKVIWRASARIDDYKAFQADGADHHSVNEILTRHATTVSLGDVTEGTNPIFQPTGIPGESGDKLDYIINFWALNGAWVQELHWQLVNGKSEYATRVFRQHFPSSGDVTKVKLELLKTDVSAHFPGKDKGIEWLPDSAFR